MILSREYYAMIHVRYNLKLRQNNEFDPIGKLHLFWA